MKEQYISKTSVSSLDSHDIHSFTIARSSLPVNKDSLLQGNKEEPQNSFYQKSDLFAWEDIWSYQSRDSRKLRVEEGKLL